MTTGTEALPVPGRMRALWAAAHAPMAGVPRWARISAYTVPFTVLPSSAWRIATVVFHAPLGDGSASDAGSLPSWMPIQLYVVLLSLFSELLAFTAVGLVASWGETFPRWIPALGGRKVPAAASTAVAAAGAVILTVLWTAVAVTGALGRTLRGGPLPKTNPLATHDWHAVVLAVTYAPLLLWGPLLGAVTVAYWQRRRRVTVTTREAVPVDSAL